MRLRITETVRKDIRKERGAESLMLGKPLFQEGWRSGGRQTVAGNTSQRTGPEEQGMCL